MANKDELIDWLRFNLGNMGALTGTDFRALDACWALVKLYAYDGDPSILEAFALTARRMQPTTIEYAYHAIAQVLDWKDRQTIWNLAGLPPIIKPMVCKAEPRKAGA